MKRLWAILALTAAVSVVLFFVLRARFGKEEVAEEGEKEKGSGAKAKKGPSDFAKSKAGLIRQSDLESGSKIDPESTPSGLGEYVALREKTLEKWKKTKLSVEWENVTLAEAFGELATRFGLEARLDPAAASIACTFRVDELEAIAALDLVTRMADLAWIVNQAGELWVIPRDKLTAYAPAGYFDWAELQGMRAAVLADRNAGVTHEPQLARKLRDTAIAARQIRETDLQGFLEFVMQVAEVNIVTRPVENPPQVPTMTPLEGESIDSFLRRGLEPLGFTFTVTDDSVIVLTREQLEAEKKETSAREDERKGRIDAERQFFKRPVTVGGDDMTLRDLAEALGRALEVPVVIDPTSWRRAARYSFKPIEQPAEEVVRILKKSAPVEVTWRDGKLWFLAPEELHLSADH